MENWLLKTKVLFSCHSYGDRDLKGKEDEQQKGVYVIQPHKVQGIIMLLAGISDMVDETYTQRAWEATEENKTLL